MPLFNFKSIIHCFFFSLAFDQSVLFHCLNVYSFECFNIANESDVVISYEITLNQNITFNSLLFSQNISTASFVEFRYLRPFFLPFQSTIYDINLAWSHFCLRNKFYSNVSNVWCSKKFQMLNIFTVICYPAREIPPTKCISRIDTHTHTLKPNTNTNTNSNSQHTTWTWCLIYAWV